MDASQNPAELFNQWRRLLNGPENSDLANVLGRLTGDSPAELATLVAFARDPLGRDPADIARSPLEYEFLRNLRRVHRRHSVSDPENDRRYFHIAPMWTDALHDHQPVMRWGAAQALNAVVMRQRRPTRRTAVVVCMRDDGISILEWVAHYLAIGVDSIFVYSNDNADGSEALLMELSHHEVITYIDNRCDLQNGIHPQRKAFAHSLNLLPELWDHEWVFFLDSDELFIPGQGCGHSLSAVLDRIDNRFSSEKPSAVCFNWRWYYSGETYAYQDELLLTRFQHGGAHQSPKSLVYLQNAYSMSELHFPSLINEGFFVRGDLSRFEVDDRYTVTDAVYDCGQLNHYWTKSFEEYANKKWRGDTVRSSGSYFSRSFDQFFTWNEAETPANWHPPPVELVDRVRLEMRKLLALPNVSELHSRLQAEFPKRIQALGGAHGLRHIFEISRVRALNKKNIAIGCPAHQSSVSQWSTVNDAQGAVSGTPARGGFNFHTDLDPNPWWEVDLGSEHALDSIFIYNRMDQAQERSRTLKVSLSTDGERFTVVYDHTGLPPFGGHSPDDASDPQSQPLCVVLNGANARFVRLELQERTYFHLDQVEVYGRALSAG